MTDRHSATYDVQTGVCSLVLRDCQQSDTGVYSCRAGNVCGRATCTANVVVVRTRPLDFVLCAFGLGLAVILWWLGGRVVSVLDSGAEGPGYKS